MFDMSFALYIEEKETVVCIHYYNVLRFSIIINFSITINTIMSIPLVIIHNIK